AMITGQSVNLSVLSGHLPGESSVEAKKRRVERAFRDEQLTGELFLSLMLPLLPPGKLLMSLDRTTWNHGSSPLNLLVLGVVLHGYTLPLVWTALPHDGNSSTDIRQELVQRLLKALPARRWKGLVADREFIGGAWFAFLRQQRIKRAIRIRKDAVVDGLRIDEWFGDLQVGEIHTLFDRAEVYGERMRVVATRSPAGDLVVIATDFPVWETLALYRQRWSIENMHQSMKGRGFDLEATRLTQGARLSVLFGVVVLAFVWCCLSGAFLARKAPPKMLKHGYPAKSMFRMGLDALQDALSSRPGKKSRTGTSFRQLLATFDP
ncbi:IS4 family transposase, partial [Deinococcus ruber]|uniref:IS4 family transposase n=1 Tax=Deinococcus ruber TaxID=1848197 RepID=UPI001666DC82